MKELSYTYYQLKFLWKQEKKRVFLAILLAVLATALCLVVGTKAYAEKMQTGIAAKVVRFHVLANSDSQQDQDLKLAVRDCILEELGEELEQCKTKAETEVFLRRSFERIERIAVQEIQRQGYGYPVKVSLEKTAFPLKTYGDFSFPAGVYDALRVEIGRGEGQNWWCVMYPPMCFVDASCGEVTVDSELRLKGTLTQEEFTLIHTEKEEIHPNVKFKIVEWWQERSEP